MLTNLQRPNEAVEVLDILAERLKTSDPEWAARALQQSAITVGWKDPMNALDRCQKALALVPADSPMARELKAYSERMKAKLPEAPRTATS